MSMLPHARPSPAGLPERERLQAVVEMIVAGLRPDQIILFGSGARGEMTEWSDLDLLVLREPEADGQEVPQRLWRCPRTNGSLDVLVMTRADAEAGRRRAGDVRQAALEDGRTVYTRPGVVPLPTGRAYASNGVSVVASTPYEPDKSAELLDQAERKWRLAEREEHPADKCEMLQASMERALKALIAAQGMRVVHTHDLNDLWAQAERGGERIPDEQDHTRLADLSRYATTLQYDNPPQAVSAKTWEESQRMGEGLLRYARTRVPELAERTRERIEAMDAPHPGAGRGGS